MIVLVVVIGLVAWLVASSSTHRAPASARVHSADSRLEPPKTATAVASIASWHLPDALSRAAATGLSGGRILLLGGLFPSGTSSADVGVLNTSTGTLRSVATLTSPTHDAGSSVLLGKVFIFGGGESTPFATVEAVTLPAGAVATGLASAVTGQLPQLRADDEAVSIGGTAYVIGGYDGSSGDAAVLSTRNGSTFSTIATLAVGVRYAAVAAASGMIYVFGGEAALGGTTPEYSLTTGSTSPPPGQGVAVVQEIDPQTHTARVVGSLPYAVQGAAAFDLGGRIFVAGGDSNAPGSTPHSGSTIWSFNPSNGVFDVVGHLAAPVAYAALALEGHAAWLVGGERDGIPVNTAQKIVVGSS